MSALTQDPVFQAYVVTATLLALNLVGLANATAVTRGQASEVINPEDQKLNGSATVVFEGGNDRTARYRRAHRNALENTPLFMITGLVFVMVQPAASLAIGIFAAYATARILHSVCYVKGIQPFRTIAFVVGMLAQVTMLGVLIWKVFAG
jgi:uncharacterized MAPEG superfamily protein